MDKIKIPPVLFIVFNRPDITSQSLNILRKNKVPKIYISQDGPRENLNSDIDKCKEVKKIISTIDWPCEVITQYHERNLGCKEGVISAIDWFFTLEEEELY